MTNAAQTMMPAVGRKYLTFFLGNEEYGIDLLRIQEIVGLLPVTRVPGTPPFVLGVVNLRGRVVPVIDLCARLGIVPAEGTRRGLVFVRAESFLLGLLVDRVNDVLTLAEDSSVPVPDFGAGVDTSFLSGLARQQDRLTMLLDVTRILTPSESSDLAQLA